MRTLRQPALGVIASILLPAVLLSPQSKKSQQAQPPRPTWFDTTNLVSLHVTVLNKQGQPVVSALTQKDFHIIEDGKPQPIRSFEAPRSRVVRGNASENNPNHRAPTTIIVLDFLNSGPEDFVYIRDEVHRFLMRQPALLPAPAELTVLGNNSLATLQSYTRSRDELVQALDRLPAAIPQKQLLPAFALERFTRSEDALRQIALQNEGVPGHKNIIWVGYGGPGIYLSSSFSGNQHQLREYARLTVNLLADSRITLYVVYPGIKANNRAMTPSNAEAGLDIGGNDPFAGSINLGLFVETTGGRLLNNENDVAHLMSRYSELGSKYYTLSYQPAGSLNDVQFGRIRVTVDHSSYSVITIARYYVPTVNLGAASPPPRAAQGPSSRTATAGPSIRRDLLAGIAYGNATPYMLDSAAELKKAVPQLRGLNYDPEPQQLPTILAKAGARLTVLAQRIPDLLARDNVFQTRDDVYNSVSETIRHHFSVLILRKVENGNVSFVERRRTAKGKIAPRYGLDRGFAVTQGFVFTWALFYPANHVESSFRYLGTQEVRGYHTLVVAFAQNPVIGPDTSVCVINGKPIDLLYQGVAWFDESTFNVIRLRTDLLAPRSDVGLMKLTSVASFGAVNIKGLRARLWLPIVTHVKIDEWFNEGAQEIMLHGAAEGLGHEVFSNIDHYTDYRLFHVRSRLLLTPP